MPTKFLYLTDKFGIREYLDTNTFVSPVGCWLYTAYLDKDGYGSIKIEKKAYRVHRLSLYIFKNFNLKSKLLALHIVSCKNKNCWNPKHLYVGDNSDNQIDSVKASTNYESRRTHCEHGHEFNKENTYIPQTGVRQCITCRNIRDFKRKR